ncbi:MAG: hypothetical protein IKN73_02715 [Alphaproteobacteria bacterium]|jgi:hypothetical protein|nr:hypothetical protein [Alphaproteobacteria bacterium]
MQFNKSSALDRLNNLGMDDMPVIEYTPTKCIVDNTWFSQYVKLRREFLTSLTDSFTEIAFMNLSQDEFVNLVMGKSIPDNLSIRFRIPLMWGGTLTIDNLFMCFSFPHSQNLDRFIIEQFDAKTVFLPNPAKKIYVPSHLSGGGPGGNAASDRLSQAAMNFASSRGNE